ncbi:MAG: Flp pilus assembly protein CpaB [Actinomycetales bacterium]|nr:Flp pilus assembly protein CpaB [Actinomycetales bacterium]
MGRRTILLITSVLLAGLGTVMVYLYAQRADERATRDQTLVRVLFATGPIPEGTSAEQAAEQGLLEARPFPQRYVPRTAVQDVKVLGTKVSLTKIAADQPILLGQFGAPSEVSMPVDIPPGKMAVAVELSDPARVVGLVGPSSMVTVFATVNDERRGEVTQVLLPKVQVLRVGQSVPAGSRPAGTRAGSNDEEVARQILTLAVDASEAQKVIFAQKRGQLWLALLRPDAETRQVGPTTARNLFGGAA